MGRRPIGFKRAEPTIENKTPAERMYSCAERPANHRVRVQVDPSAIHWTRLQLGPSQITGLGFTLNAREARLVADYCRVQLE